ncbi:MAG TPA: ABC transporter ATP-binding protein [Trueperaceae bacterium]|nr:ABC transporter ATP-binding protein [Trueperaceae bacterium]
MAATDLQATPLLQVEDVGRSFGGLKAVDGVSFDVRGGSVTGLIGPNGAGKSTLFDLITGVTRADSGSVRLDALELRGKAPDVIARAGLARTFQTPRIFTAMSVWENLMVGGNRHPGEGLWGSLLPNEATRSREGTLMDRALELLAFLGLEHLAGARADSLSGGQRKLLTLGRALMADPRLLLLDEPAAGVNQTLTRTLMARIADLRERGVTVLVVEHDMDLIMQLCDHVVVMHQGKVLAQGAPGAMQRDARVLEAYLGGVT